VIAIYFTHWLVVGWGVGIFGFRSQPLTGALIGIVVAIVATALLSRYAAGLETPAWLMRWATQRNAAPSEAAIGAPAPGSRSSASAILPPP
jgi:hypothetical protein